MAADDELRERIADIIRETVWHRSISDAVTDNEFAVADRILALLSAQPENPEKVTLALWEKKLLVRSVPMGKVHYRSDSFGDIISWLESKGFKYQHGTRGIFTRERPTVEGA